MGFPFFIGWKMTKKTTQKVYFNSDQQIEKLRADGLLIPDEAHAKRRLKWEGYYNFAVGYNRLFKDQNKRYRKGVSFEHVEALFDFDKRLREIVYEATQQVECNVKAMLSDVFSARYGVDEKVYLQEGNFTQAPADLPHVRWMIGRTPARWDLLPIGTILLITIKPIGTCPFGCWCGC